MPVPDTLRTADKADISLSNSDTPSREDTPDKPAEPLEISKCINLHRLVEFENATRN
jgi:hypothetical protein